MNKKKIMIAVLLTITAVASFSMFFSGLGHRKIHFNKEGVQFLGSFESLYAKNGKGLFKVNRKIGAYNARNCFLYFAYLSLHKPSSLEELGEQQAEMLNNMDFESKKLYFLDSWDFTIDCLVHFNALNLNRQIRWDKEGLTTLAQFENLYGNEFDTYFVREKGRNADEQESINENNLSMCVEFYFSINHHELLAPNIKNPMNIKQVKTQKNTFIEDCLYYFQ